MNWQDLAEAQPPYRSIGTATGVAVSPHSGAVVVSGSYGFARFATNGLSTRFVQWVDPLPFFTGVSFDRFSDDAYLFGCGTPPRTIDALDGSAGHDPGLGLGGNPSAVVDSPHTRSVYKVGCEKSETKVLAVNKLDPDSPRTVGTVDAPADDIAIAPSDRLCSISLAV